MSQMVHEPSFSRKSYLKNHENKISCLNNVLVTIIFEQIMPATLDFRKKLLRKKINGFAWCHTLIPVT